MSNADPGAVQAFFQNEITLCGSNLLSATEIQFGAEALGPADFTVVDDEHLRLAVPAPEALGTKLVTVTTAGGSASILVDVIATQPPVLVAPTLGLPGQPFTAEWAGGSGDVFFLLASPLSSTIPLFGVQVLGPQPIVAPSGTLDAVGYGSLTIPSLPSLSQGWYLQILTFGGPGVSAAMASNVAGTFFL